MTTRPDPGPDGPVLFVSFSVLMTALLGVLFLAACSTRETPTEPPEVVVIQSPSPPPTPPTPPAASPDSNAHTGVEERVVREEAGPALTGS